MQLNKKTNIGVISASYKPDSNNPGVYVDFKPDGEKDYRPVVTVEYDSGMDMLRVHLWDCIRDEEPTHSFNIQIE